MKFIADFHIHSHHSVATSGNLVPEYLEYWARLKGIDVVGTGDCIHPGWHDELKEKLEPAGNGFYRLRSRYRLEESRFLPAGNMPKEVFFILTGEISNIYKKNGRVRKVHNLCVFPDFAAAGNVMARLDRMANIRSDGRPILGLDSKILLEMVLQSSEQSYLIPCHIWTPWFSVLGSKSGFDSIDECYDDLSRHIFALETGLSSDPPMNRACSFLDRFTLVSNSDAHSPEKLGREANLFDTELSYGGVHAALKSGEGFAGTIEFFPQEGKYHYDGHRKCGIRWDPLETLRRRGTCPKCGKPVTRGVMYRVAELADRREPGLKEQPAFYSITQLADLLAELLDQKTGKSVKVFREYHRLTGSLGSEFYILLEAPLGDIRDSGGELLAEGIRRLRNCEVIIDEGYDGEFGRIKVFRPGEIRSFAGSSLFGGAVPADRACGAKSSIQFDISEFRKLLAEWAPADGAQRLVFDLPDGRPGRVPAAVGLTDDQRSAVEHGEGPCMVIAGPGTGKTGILTRRIARLVKDALVPPAAICAMTFSNRAADEMRARVQRLIQLRELTIGTFHAFGLGILREHCDEFGRTRDFAVAGEDDIRELVSGLVKTESSVRKAIMDIGAVKQGRMKAEEILDLFNGYNDLLLKNNCVDLDDLIYLPLLLFRIRPDILDSCRRRYRWILVDEFQDINAAQYEFLRELAGVGSPNLFVIGDPDQAIYGFRGSDIRFISRIAEDYPGIRTIRLDRSFRCPEPVIRAAAQALGRKRGIAGRESDVRVRIQETETDRSEADWIASTIEKRMGGVRSFSMDSGISDGDAAEEGVGFADFAVLCRSALLFGTIEEAFRNHAIPYQVAGSEAFLRDEPYRSVVRSLRNIIAGKAADGISDGVAGDIRGMMGKGDSASDIIKFLMVIREAPEDAIRRITSFAEPYGNGYQEFFRACAMRQGADDRDDRAEAVSLMTIHAAKGLEFNTVFIPACERGIIPFELFGKKGEDEIAEEERLFYVGITRTLQNLFVSWAKKRVVRGRVLKQERSPLLDRLEETLVRKGKREQTGKRKSGDLQLDLFNTSDPGRNKS